MYEEESRLIAPFAVTGGVLAFFGALLLCFSVEVCVRLRKNAKRVKDPEIDKLKNLHHIKHWMPPELIPYGWGHSGAESGGDLKEAIVFDESAELARSRGGAGASRMSGSADSSGGGTARSASAAVHVVRPASGSSEGKGGDEK